MRLAARRAPLLQRDDRLAVVVAGLARFPWKNRVGLIALTVGDFDDLEVMFSLPPIVFVRIPTRKDQPITKTTRGAHRSWAPAAQSSRPYSFE